MTFHRSGHKLPLIKPSIGNAIWYLECLLLYSFNNYFPTIYIHSNTHCSIINQVNLQRNDNMPLQLIISKITIRFQTYKIVNIKFHIASYMNTIR